jgi:SP family sugar:H+ symporter-like MFS transporter
VLPCYAFLLIPTNNPSSATPYLVGSEPGQANLGAKVFFIWGGCCFVCMFFVWAFIYETKGLALEQVDELYAKVPHAWQSPGFVPTVSFQDVQESRADPRRMSLVEMEQEAIRKKSVTQYETGGSIGEKNSQK